MKVLGIMGAGSLAFLLFAADASAQVPRPPVSQIEAIDKLEHWVGEWKGTGWAATGPQQRAEFTITESIQRKIHGSVLLVEGRGTVRLEDGEELVTHEALAVLSYDHVTKAYRWRTYDLRGIERDAEFEVTEKGATWGFQDERGALLRFTIEVDAEHWHENGEVSLDGGETWFHMLEMTLVRAGDPPH